MTKHAATLALTQALLEPPGSLPEGHLALINALQAGRGKAALAETDLIARPVWSCPDLVDTRTLDVA